MLSEFDDASPNSWLRHVDFIQAQTQAYLQTRRETGTILFEDHFGVDPWLYAQYQKATTIQHDPFLPKDLRRAIYELYEQRIDQMTEVQDQVLDRFLINLENGTLSPADADQASEWIWTQLQIGYLEAGVIPGQMKEKILAVTGMVEGYVLPNQ